MNFNYNTKGPIKSKTFLQGYVRVIKIIKTRSTRERILIENISMVWTIL